MPKTTLLGRERELAHVGQLVLSGGVRLLTLTGVGGTGKSRLALAAALDLAPAFEDVVWLVDLATVRDARLFLAAVVQALEIPESGNRPLAQILREKLAERAGLLVLDNFEQILDAATLVGDLVAACAGLVVLVTSREPLGLRAEHVFQVHPLAVPNFSGVVDVQSVGWVPSVVLFEDRARAQQLSFRLTERNVGAVADICARLDGLPLAIELAAAQAGVFSPETILTRLINSAPLVLSGSPELPPRHQTLRATVAWSYDLLPPHLQTMFCYCGVFAGGFTAEAVDALRGTSGTPTDTLATLAQLVLKNLVSVTDLAAATPRFTMLKILRAFCLDHLAASDELEEARRRHALYYLGLAEGARAEQVQQLRGPLASELFDRLALEYANFRDVFAWSSDTRNLSVGLRLAAALYPFWLARGYVSEARDWLATALPHAATVAPSVRAGALYAAGMLAAVQHDYEPAAALLSESLQITESDAEEGDTRLNLELFVRAAQGDVLAVAACLEALESPREESLAPAEKPKLAPRLTPREREIAGLVAQGRSNREIASLLFVGTRTVETHLEHVFRKLAVQSRAEVAVWGVKNGLPPSLRGRA